VAPSVVPPGLESFLPLFPALKCWAKVGRPSGASAAVQIGIASPEVLKTGCCSGESGLQEAKSQELRAIS
jgi:hypothetical protein